MTEKRYKHMCNEFGKFTTHSVFDTETKGAYGDDNYQKIVDLLNEQDQRIKELEEQLKLVCEADCVTPHDSVKEILRDEIKGIDTVAGESAMAWHAYCVLDKVFREQYDNELWDNYDD